MSKRVAVLGGGISGLSAAWNLTKTSTTVKVVLYEASRRVGGWISSERTNNGAVFELGPRSLRTAGASARTTMELLSSLGLENEVLPITKLHKAAQRRLIYTQHHGMVEVPSNFSWVFRTKPPFSKPMLWYILKDLFTKKGSGDQTVHEFVSRRLGNEVLEYLVDPMCRGIYASGVKNLSIQSCFPVLYEAEQTHRSIILGLLRTKAAPIPTTASSLLKQSSSEKWTIYTLSKGLGHIPEAMHECLIDRGVEIKLGVPCSRLDFVNGKVVVESPGGEREEYDHVVSTVPSHALAELLSESPHSTLAENLRSIKSVTVGVVCLEYEGNDVLPQEYREAFGYLVPSSIPSQVLGVVFDSSTFPQHDRKDRPSTRLTVMLGGEWFEKLFGQPEEVSEESIIQAALEELKNQLGITERPTHQICRIQKNCIPLYEVGHSKKLDFISHYLSQRKVPLTLTGSSYEGVSVNDVIHNAVKSTNNIV